MLAIQQRPQVMPQDNLVGAKLNSSISFSLGQLAARVATIAGAFLSFAFLPSPFNFLVGGALAALTIIPVILGGSKTGPLGPSPRPWYTNFIPFSVSTPVHTPMPVFTSPRTTFTNPQAGRRATVAGHAIPQRATQLRNPITGFHPGARPTIGGHLGIPPQPPVVRTPTHTGPQVGQRANVGNQNKVVLPPAPRNVRQPPQPPVVISPPHVGTRATIGGFGTPTVLPPPPTAPGFTGPQGGNRATIGGAN